MTALWAVCFQTFTFVFSAFNRKQGDGDLLLTHSVPHLFTLALCIWYIVREAKWFLREQIKQENRLQEQRGDN